MKKTFAFVAFLTVLFFFACSDDKVKKYKITYIDNLGSGIVPQSVEIDSGKSVILPKNDGMTAPEYVLQGLEKEAYGVKFVGWQISINGILDTLSAGKIFFPSGNITIPAVWKDTVKTGKVTFFNQSSYRITIHYDHFYNNMFVDLNSGENKTLDVRISNNNGLGSIFSVQYHRLIADTRQNYTHDLWVNGIDPNVQFPLNIEEGKTVSYQIQNPKNLKYGEAFDYAFFEIYNSSNMPCDLILIGSLYKTGDVFAVPVGKTGMYKIDAKTDGSVQSGFKIGLNFEYFPITDFTAKRGHIYSFYFDGKKVMRANEAPGSSTQFERTIFIN